ncbi:MAG: 50S ribosomal protein L18 [Legionella sp.]
MNKQIARKRRATKTKHIINNSKRPRLVVYRSGLHIYSQILLQSENGDKVIVSSSTIDKQLKAKLTGNKCDQAFQVGKLLAERAIENKIFDVAFDRCGYKYHGRVKALASGAREAGLNF